MAPAPVQRAIRTRPIWTRFRKPFGGRSSCCGNSEPPKQAATEAGKATPPAAAAAPSESYLDKIKARDKLIVGVFTGKPPFGYVDGSGRYLGFDSDLGRRFAKDLLGDESNIEFVAVESASRIPFLQSNKVDLVFSNMTVMPERAEVVDFTNPNLRVDVQLLVQRRWQRAETRRPVG